MIFNWPCGAASLPNTQAGKSPIRRETSDSLKGHLQYEGWPFCFRRGLIPVLLAHPLRCFAAPPPVQWVEGSASTGTQAVRASMLVSRVVAQTAGIKKRFMRCSLCARLVGDQYAGSGGGSQGWGGKRGHDAPGVFSRWSGPAIVPFLSHDAECINKWAGPEI